jgi:hypothetical protein
MPYKKIIIIILAIILIVGGVVTGSLLFPKKEAPKIEPPLNASQTEQAFNNITSQAQSVIATPPDFGLSSSSIALSSSSSRSGFTDDRQATIKTFDEQTSFLQLQIQDIEPLIGEQNIINLGESILMYLDFDVEIPNNFFYLKQGESFRYVGRGIQTVEKINLDNQNYWVVVQTNIFGNTFVGIFNEEFTAKSLISIPSSFLFSSVKSVSNENIIISVANGNGRGAILSDFTINLREYIDKLTPFLS